MRFVLVISVMEHLIATFSMKKNDIFDNKFFFDFWPPRLPPGVPHFSALDTNIENRLDSCSNLAN